SSFLPKPINVSFTSVNLRNVLRWDPGNGTSDGTHFTVEYAIYGETTEVSKGKGGRWRAAHQCTDIVRTWCDLSVETWAEEEGYYARVRALGKKSTSKWTVTKRRFDPKWETIFGPPLVSVEIENNSAIVTLKGPMRYSPNNHTPPLSMKAIYSRMSYNLSIYNIYRNQMHHFPVETNTYKYQLLDYNTEYCFFAKSRFLSIPVQCTSSAWHCIITPQDPVIKQLQRVVVGIVVPFLCICIIVLISYPLYNYLAGKGQKSPFTLNRVSFHPNPLVLFPDKVNLEITRIIADKPPPAIDIPSIIAYPQNRYSPQVTDVPREPEEPMNDLSIDYGSVIMAPKVKVHGEADTRQRKHKRGYAVNNLTDEHQKCADSDKKKDVNVKDDNAAGGYKPQTQRFGQSPIVEPAETKVSTLLQTRPRSQGNLALLTQTRAPIQSNETSVSDKQTTGCSMEPSNLFFNNTPQTDTFNYHLNLPSLKEGVKKEELEAGEQKQNQCENVPLLSDYASQNIPNMPTVHSQQSDCLSDDYGFLFSAAAQKAEAVVEMEKGARCSNRNPEIMKLVLPWMEMSNNKEERLGGMPSSERETEGKIAGNCKEMYTTRSHLKLESVLIRQASDEEARPQVEGELGSEADDILSKWDLVISMDA
ncbi:hypothetical protein AMECASPLE_035701, partial [Ameca splendens]